MTKSRGRHEAIRRQVGSKERERERAIIITLFLPRFLCCPHPKFFTPGLYLESAISEDGTEGLLGWERRESNRKSIASAAAAHSCCLFGQGRKVFLLNCWLTVKCEKYPKSPFTLFHTYIAPIQQIVVTLLWKILIWYCNARQTTALFLRVLGWETL